MTTKREALELFNTMYTERTIRDHYFDIRSLCTDESESKQLTDMAFKHNAASNDAMMRLQDAGYSAFRDDDNDYTPTLRKNGLTIATWSECNGVTEAAPYVNPSVEVMATAIQTVPGFEKLVWKAANALHDVRAAIDERREYEKTHSSKRGSQYAKLTKRENAAGDVFFFATGAVDCILDALAPDIEVHATLEEVSELVAFCSPAELYHHARI